MPHLINAVTLVFEQFEFDSKKVGHFITQELHMNGIDIKFLSLCYESTYSLFLNFMCQPLNIFSAF